VVQERVAEELVWLETVTEERVGGVVSVTALLTVTATLAEVAVLPAASRTTAVRVWNALVAVVVSQETEYGEVVSSVPRFAPSSLNWTPETATLSEALAETVIVPATVAPEAGEEMETVGGVRSEGGTGTALLPENIFAGSQLNAPMSVPASPLPQRIESGRGLMPSSSVNGILSAPSRSARLTNLGSPPLMP